MSDVEQEQAAVARLRSGDINGLENLVRHYHLPAVRAAYLVVRDPAIAEDVVQTAWVNLVEKIHQYDPRRPFGPWFLRSVVNASINVAKRQERWLSLDGGREDSPVDIAQVEMSGWVAALPGPEEAAEAHEIQNAIWDALAKLTPQQRAAVVMRYYFGLSEADMSQEMAAPPSSIKWWLNAARLRLRSLLSPRHLAEPQPVAQPAIYKVRDLE